MENNSFKLLNIQLSLVNIDSITDEMVKQSYENKIEVYMQMKQRIENKIGSEEKENRRTKYETQIELIEKEMQEICEAYKDLETKEKRSKYYEEMNASTNTKEEEAKENQINLKAEKFNKQMREFRNKYNIGVDSKDLNPIIIYKGKIGDIAPKKDER